jgi:glucokinase
MPAPYCIGVDLGGTKILTGLFDAHYRLLARHKRPTDAAQGKNTVLGHLRTAVDKVLEEAGLEHHQVTALGMGIPGQVDPEANMVRYAPNLGWKNLDLARELERYWPWRCFFENDVKVGTYGEFTHGAAQGARHVLGVFVGTGVGGGLILNGELYHGFNFSAGEIGHIILDWRKGTDLEMLSGRRSMMRRGIEMTDGAPKKCRKIWNDLDPEGAKSSQLADLYARDDPIAIELVDDATRALGAALGSAINLLSPEIIVLGGGLAGALGEPFRKKIWEIALGHALPHAARKVRCVPAKLEDDSGIYGAAAYAHMKMHGKKARAIHEPVP